MKIKKLLMLFFVMTLVISLPLAIAEDETTDDSTTLKEDEAEIVNETTSYGAEVRVLQLQKAISRNIVAGEEVLEAVKDTITDEDKTKAQEIIDTLKTLKTETEEFNYEEEADVLAELYVSLKKDARDLGKEFRDLTKDYLKDIDMQQLRKRIQEKNQKNSQVLSEKIKEKRQADREERLLALLNRLGIEDEEVIAKIKAGELNIGQARSALVKATKGLSKEKREQALEKVKTEKTKRDQMKQKAMNKIKVAREKMAKNSSPIAQKVKERAKERLAIHRETLNGKGGPNK